MNFLKNLFFTSLMFILISEVSQAQWSPLMSAAFYNDISSARSLIASGANVNYFDEQFTKFGPTALVIAASEGHAEMVDLLIASGADVNLGNPLKSACNFHSNSKESILESLIQAGADVDAGGDTHHTPLMAAASRGYVRGVEILLQAGADPYIARTGRHPESGYTALIYAYVGDWHFNHIPTFQDRLFEVRDLLQGEMTRRENAAR